MQTTNISARGKGVLVFNIDVQFLEYTAQQVESVLFVIFVVSWLLPTAPQAISTVLVTFWFLYQKRVIPWFTIRERLTFDFYPCDVCRNLHFYIISFGKSRCRIHDERYFCLGAG